MSYVLAGYGATIGALVAYAVWVTARVRRARQGR